MPNELNVGSENTNVGPHKYQQLAARLRQQILRKELQSGDRLPSYMELRKEYGVTLSTVERVYGLLENEGLVERRHGSGTFVAEPQNRLTGTLGFIGGALANQQHNPFDTLIMEGVQQAVESQRQHLLYMGTDYSLNLQGCEKVDGVLICNIEDSATVSNRLPILMPRVSLLTVADGMSSVVADDYRGAKAAVKYLLELGHRRIACLMEKQPSIARSRFAGYLDAMEESDLDADSRWANRATVNAKSMGTAQPYLAWARIHMTKWLQQDWSELGCTAILVQNEVAAIGVMQILQENDIKVPQDISVMGFDGTETCNLITPSLMAMALPLEQIGRKAVEVLNRQIAHEHSAEEVIMLPMSLRQGGSVAPPG